MDLNYFEQKLLAKQLQLQSDLAALEGEARDAGDVEARDNTDDATADQSTSEALEEGGVISQTLQRVAAALQRIKDGTFGRCTICGRQIPPARLEAIPWTEYCVEDQEKLDKATLPAQGSTL
jgi:DnaK suppressor protein